MLFLTWLGLAVLLKVARFRIFNGGSIVTWGRIGVRDFDRNRLAADLFAIWESTKGLSDSIGNP